MKPLVRHELAQDVVRGQHRFQMLRRRDQRGLHRRRVAVVCILHRHGHDRAGVQVDRVLRFVREMRPPILHLGDLRVGIMRMRPVVIGALLLASPIDPREVGTRRRADPGGLRQRREKLLIALAGITTDDAAKRRIRFQRGAVQAERRALQQLRRRQRLEHPHEHGLMGLEIDEPACTRDRRVIRRRLVQRQAEEVAQRQRVGRSPARSESSPSK